MCISTKIEKNNNKMQIYLMVASVSHTCVSECVAYEPFFGLYDDSIQMWQSEQIDVFRAHNYN